MPSTFKLIGALTVMAVGSQTTFAVVASSAIDVPKIGSICSQADTSISAKLPIGSREYCENAACLPGPVLFAYHCKVRTGPECGVGWNWLDDDYRYRRSIQEFFCSKPGGNQTYIACLTAWALDGCCTGGASGALPSCVGPSGEQPCGVGAGGF